MTDAERGLSGAGPLYERGPVAEEAAQEEVRIPGRDKVNEKPAETEPGDESPRA